MKKQYPNYDSGYKGTQIGKINDGAYKLFCKSNDNRFLTLSNKNNQKVLTIEETRQDPTQCFFIKFSQRRKSYTIMSLLTHQIISFKKSDQNFIFSNDGFTEWTIEISKDGDLKLKLNKTDLYLSLDNSPQITEFNQKSKSQLIKLGCVGPIFNVGVNIIPKSIKKLVTFSKEKENEDAFLAPKNDKNKQLFWIEFDKLDGCYLIFECDKYHCISSNNKNVGSTIGQHSCYSLDYQKWVIYPFNGKAKEFYLELKSNLLRLTTPFDNEKYLKLEKIKNNDDSQLFHFKLSDFKVPGNSLKYIKERKNFRYSTELSINEFKHDNLGNCDCLSYLKINCPFTDQHRSIFRNCKRIKVIDCHPEFLNLLPNPLNVEVIFIQEKVTDINKNTFENFVNLKALSLPKSLKNVKYKVFDKIYGLNYFCGDPIHLLYMNKAMLIEVVIPDYVKKIPNEAFAGCRLLKKVPIKGTSHLESIGSKSFAHCKSLKEFKIPKTVKYILYDAFYDCNPEYSLDYLTKSQKESMKDNLVIDSKYSGITIDLLIYKNVVSLEISLKIRNCEDNVLEQFKYLNCIKCHPSWLNKFDKSNSIEVVFIPYGVKRLRKKDFLNVPKLIMIDIPETVTKIDQDCFDSCQKLKKYKCGMKHLPFLDCSKINFLILNDEVVKISDHDFDELINLQYLIVPDEIIAESEKIFINCKKLMEVNKPELNALINNSYKGVDITEITSKMFKGWINLHY